jgi:hypothetical protein
VTLWDKSYNLQPILEEGNGGGKFAELGKSRESAREWAAFFVQAGRDLDAIDHESQASPYP